MQIKMRQWLNICNTTILIPILKIDNPILLQFYKLHRVWLI